MEQMKCMSSLKLYLREHERTGITKKSRVNSQKYAFCSRLSSMLSAFVLENLHTTGDVEGPGLPYTAVWYLTSAYVSAEVLRVGDVFALSFKLLHIDKYPSSTR